eukprot:gene16105-8798_t
MLDHGMLETRAPAAGRGAAAAAAGLLAVLLHSAILWLARQ